MTNFNRLKKQIERVLSVSLSRQADWAIRSQYSGSLTSDSLGELHITGHDGDSLGVDGAKVGVLEEANHVSLSGLLKGKDGGRLESKVALGLVGNLTDESLERKLSDEELRGLLVSSDLSEGDGTGLESVGSLDTSGGVGSLSSGGLVADGLSGVLGTGRLSSGMLGSSHLIFYYNLLQGQVSFKLRLNFNLRYARLFQDFRSELAPYLGSARI